MTDAEKVKRIKGVVKMAEDWAEKQLMPNSHITNSALRDIRRIVRTESK